AREWCGHLQRPAGRRAGAPARDRVVSGRERIRYPTVGGARQSRGVNALAVYCASRRGTDARHLTTAAELGAALAHRGIELVYGGGHVGLMGVVADAALAAGGKVTGVITESLVYAEVGHAGLSELITVPTMHERKAIMNERADAFVMLPGGYGTLDEFF